MKIRARTLASCAILASPTLAHAIEAQVPSAPYPTLAVALANAEADGIDTITILDTAAGEAADIVGAFNLDVVNGPITIRGEAGTKVVVDAFGLDSVFTCQDNDVDPLVFENLTLRGGASNNRGGALFINASIDVTVSNCQLVDNTVDDAGTTDNRGGAISMGVSATGNPGGLGNRTGSTLTIIDSTISGNSTANNTGGAIYTNGCAVTMIDSAFTDNSAPASITAAVSTGQGGVIFLNGSQMTAVGCDFSRNAVGNTGGAIYVSSSSDASFRDCTFFENSAGVVGSPQGRGGAVYVVTARSADFTNSLFVRNTAEFYGPALYTSGTIEALGCTFNDNLGNAALAGSAINSAGGTAKVANCVMIGAKDAATGTGAFDIWNSIYTGSTGTVGARDAQGSFDADPLFVNAGADDYRIQSTSPAIDAGHSLIEIGPLVQTDVLTDFAGDERGLDDPNVANTGVSAWAINVDIGAYEFQPPATNNGCIADTTTTNTNPGDPGFGAPDGTVNGADLSYFVEQWIIGCP